MSKPLPQYKCHKVVSALQISKVEWKDDESGILHFEEEGYAPMNFDYKFMKKHQPQIGSYLVVYSDEYSSVSPKLPFEEGYVLIES